MAKTENYITGVHRVKKKLRNGSIRTYHYAFRGGPRFWTSSHDFGAEDPRYVLAYDNVLRELTLTPAPTGSVRGQTKSVIARYRTSAEFVTLKPRTRDDYERYLTPFEEEFGEDPIKMFEEKESVSEIREWKTRWAHSPKQYDYATTVVTRFLNWACKEDAAIHVHHHKDVARLYKSNRADIIWLPEEIDALLDVAADEERRVIIAASEGGLTPQDIGILTRDHVQNTPLGRRLFFRRTKTGNPVSIPVTPALGHLIDTTPADQGFLVASLRGWRLTPERASQIVRDVRARANAAAQLDATRIHVRDELRLYDMRGTAATELLRAGCSLNEIAVTMGWGLRHAANVIERYAALVPEVADEVLAKLMAARARAKQEADEATTK